MGPIIFAILGTVLLWCFFMLWRNEWVYRARMRELDNPNRSQAENLREHDRLPDYDVMMRRWWIWDTEKFKK